MAKDDLFLLNTSPFTIKKMMYLFAVKYFLRVSRILLDLKASFLVRLSSYLVCTIIYGYIFLCDSSAMTKRTNT